MLTLNFESFPFRTFMNCHVVYLSVFELEQCSLHINGVEFDQDYNSDHLKNWLSICTQKKLVY